MARTRRDSPLGPEQWADAALEALSEGGLSAVAVEPIAARLGVTKGSFYHHFRSRDELIAAALERWEQVATADVIAAFSGGATPHERLERLFWTTFEAARSPEPVGLLLTHMAAAAPHPLVGPVLERVTTQRLDFLARLFVELGLEPLAAGHRAMVAYSVYLGLIQVRAAAPQQVPRGEALRAYVRHLVDTLLP